VPEQSSIKTAQDLKGKRLVLFAASPWVPMIDPFLANAGMTRNDVQVLFVDASAMYGTYSSGRADAVMTLAPFAAPILAKTMPSRSIDAADYGIVLPALGLVAREEMIASRPEVLRKVVQTTIRAWEHMKNGNVAEAVQATIKNRPDAKLDPEIIEGQAKGYLAYFDTPNTKGKPIGWQSEEDWAAAIALMIKAGLIKPGPVPKDFYTNAMVADK
jgi:NitT/TauT family transport system substrate-binding protein